MDEETEATKNRGDHRFAELKERWASLSTAKQEALLAVARTWGPDAEADEDPWRGGAPGVFHDLVDEADADAMRRATSRDERLLIATHALLGLGYDSGLREAVDDRLFVVHDEVAKMLAVLESSYSFDCSLVAALATLKADLIGFDRGRSEEDRAILRQWTAGLPQEILNVLPPDEVMATFSAPSDPGAGTAVTRIEASIEAIVQPIRHARKTGQSLSLTHELARAIRTLEDAVSAVGNRQWMADLRKILADDIAANRPVPRSDLQERSGGRGASTLDPRLEQWQDGLPQVVAEGMDPESRKSAAAYPQINKRVVRVARALLMDQDVDSARRFVESASLRRIKAIRAITPALDAITPIGREWRDVIRMLDGAFSEREALLEARDPSAQSPLGLETGSPPEGSGCTGAARHSYERRRSDPRRLGTLAFIVKAGRTWRAKGV